MRLGDLLYRLRGFSTPIGGVSWNPPTHDREVAQSLMTFLYDRRVLHAPSEAESPHHVVESVIQIRKELTALAQRLSTQSDLELKLRAMRGTCVHFLNRVQRDEAIIRYVNQAGHWANWEFIDSLGQWRAFMAVYVGMIASSYHVDPPAFLIDMLPSIPAPAPRAQQPKAKDNLNTSIDQFAALPEAERRRQIEVINKYLSSAAGQREFGHLLRRDPDADKRAFEQGPRL